DDPHRSQRLVRSRCCVRSIRWPLAEVESEKDTVTYDAMLARARRIGKDERSMRSHNDRLLVLRSLSSQSDDRRLEVWAANASGPTSADLIVRDATPACRSSP